MTELSERVLVNRKRLGALADDPEYAEYLRWKADREAEAAGPPMFSDDPVAEEAAWGNITDEDSIEDVGNIARFVVAAENPLRYLAFLADWLGKPDRDLAEDGHTAMVFTGEPEPWQLIAAWCAIETGRDEIDRIKAMVSTRITLAFPDAGGDMAKLIELYDRGVNVAANWSAPARRAAGLNR